jgi:hypothetical protein
VNERLRFSSAGSAGTVTCSVSPASYVIAIDCPRNAAGGRIVAAR